MNTSSPALERFGDVSVRLSVELGRASVPLKDVLALGEGSVVMLDRLTDELLDVTANGRIVARGEVIAQDGRFALRIVSLAGGESDGEGGQRGAAMPVMDEPVRGAAPAPTSPLQTSTDAGAPHAEDRGTDMSA
ncbi:FliM/FliN family flagellar motor switch protein [Erythrobacter sp.]|jgi:flagellar motor switch protein FliN/FliY|uniref:FliM/FliN family flagellar motor switch protein n=1 Tax=Erythrobacter sp. TaxID=1042 RepID=UPI002EA28E29|nr:FliM/FliN family flagellar motor switch protein [Erythrobacter sp.]